MKEKYTRPVIANSDVMNDLIFVPSPPPIPLALAAAVTFATKAMKAAPYVKLPNLTHWQTAYESFAISS